MMKFKYVHTDIPLNGICIAVSGWHCSQSRYLTLSIKSKPRHVMMVPSKMEISQYSTNQDTLNVLGMISPKTLTVDNFNNLNTKLLDLKLTIKKANKPLSITKRLKNILINILDGQVLYQGDEFKIHLDNNTYHIIVDDVSNLGFITQETKLNESPKIVQKRSTSKSLFDTFWESSKKRYNALVIGNNLLVKSILSKRKENKIYLDGMRYYQEFVDDPLHKLISFFESIQSMNSILVIDDFEVFLQFNPLNNNYDVQIFHLLRSFLKSTIQHKLATFLVINNNVIQTLMKDLMDEIINSSDSQT